MLNIMVQPTTWALNNVLMNVVVIWTFFFCKSYLIHGYMHLPAVSKTKTLNLETFNSCKNCYYHQKEKKLKIILCRTSVCYKSDLVAFGKVKIKLLFFSPLSYILTSTGKNHITSTAAPSLETVEGFYKTGKIHSISNF